MSEWSLYVKIPKDRIGVLIGSRGSVKETIEERLKVNLEINSKTGDVKITAVEKKDPSYLFKAKDLITAIGRGFSPENAYRLLDDENILEIIDLRDIFGRSQSDIVRVKGRIIGKEGKARRIIEEMSGALLSIYGHTVAIIGSIEQVEMAREAVRMLIKGSQHSTVYKFLQRKRREMKLRSLMLWEAETPKDLGV